MTSNQIELRKVKELERSNRENESINWAKAKESVRNNKAMEVINRYKNDITKLANDQLNEREIDKLAKNIALGYDKLEEEAYNNDLKVWAQEQSDVYKAMSNYNLESVELGQSLLSSIINALGRILGKSAKSKMSYYDSKSVIDYLLADGDIPVYSTAGSIMERGRAIYDGDKADQSRSDNTNPSLQKGYSTGRSWREETYKVQSSKPTRYRKYVRPDINEIPVDKSNSMGPGGDNYSHQQSGPKTEVNIYPNHRVLDANESPVSPGSTQRSVHGTTSGGTNYNLTGGLKSSGTIIAPV